MTLKALDKRLQKERAALDKLNGELQKARQARQRTQNEIDRAMAGAGLGDIWARATAAVAKRADDAAGELTIAELERRIAEQEERAAAALKEWQAVRFREGQAELLAEGMRVADELAAFEVKFQRLDAMRDAIQNDTGRRPVQPLGYSVVRGLLESHERWLKRYNETMERIAARQKAAAQ